MVDMLENSCINNGCLLCRYYNNNPKTILCPGQFKLASMETLIARYIDGDSVSCNRLQDALLKYYNYHINSNENNNNEEETKEMKLFAECRDECVLCACFRIGCLAGHGDDDFVQASREEMIARLYDTNISKSDKKVLIKGLEKYYHIDSSIIEQYRELVGNPYDVPIDEFLDIVKHTKECINIVKSVKPKEKPTPVTVNTDSTSIDHVNKDWLDALCDSKDYAIKYKDLAYKPQTNEDPYDFNAYIKMADELYETAMKEVEKSKVDETPNVDITTTTTGTVFDDIINDIDVLITDLNNLKEHLKSLNKWK